jgi:hypothetical protein
MSRWQWLDQSGHSVKSHGGYVWFSMLIYYGSSNKLVYLVFLCVHYSDTFFYVLIVRLTVLMWYFAFALMQSCRTVLLRSYII